MNVGSDKFKDDSQNRPAALERRIHDYEGQSSDTIDDDMKTDATLLEDTRIEAHWVRNSVRIATWCQMQGIVDRTRKQQCSDAQPVPMQLGATLIGKDKDQGKGTDGKGKRKERSRTRRQATAAERRASTATSLAT